MVKRLVAALMLIFALAAYAQTPAAKEPAEAETPTARKCFVNAPEWVVPLIPKSTRLDMVDYYEANIDRPSQNYFGGECKIIDIKDNCITFSGTKDVEYQLFLLNADRPDMVIGLIETVPTPVSDSNLTLYNRFWQKIDGFDPPRLADWLVEKKDAKEVAQSLPYVMAKYTFRPASDIVEAKSTMRDYYVADDAPEALSKIREAVTYKWNGKNFKIIK